MKSKNIRYKVICLVLLFFQLSFNFEVSNAQNLVLNPGLEDTLCCPEGIQPLICAENWIDPYSNSAEYFHTCNLAGIPSYLISDMNGNGFVGFYIYYLNTDGSEYAQAKLSQPLLAGKEYCLNFKIRPEKLGLASDEIGVYFSQTPIDTTISPLTFLEPQIQNPEGNFYKDTTQWVNFSGEFIAEGGEEYIIIGNFEIADSTQWDTISNMSCCAYIYIDDIELYDCTDTTSIDQEIENDFVVNIYPNPSNSIIFIEYNGNSGKISLVNILGENCGQYTINSSRTEIAVGHLPEGIYFVEIGNVVKKIVIDH